jgi:hypothetical protein
LGETEWDVVDRDLLEVLDELLDAYAESGRADANEIIGALASRLIHYLAVAGHKSNNVLVEAIKIYSGNLIARARKIRDERRSLRADADALRADSRRLVEQSRYVRADSRNARAVAQLCRSQRNKYIDQP